jgi:hypothetical protein
MFSDNVVIAYFAFPSQGYKQRKIILHQPTKKNLKRPFFFNKNASYEKNQPKKGSFLEGNFFPLSIAGKAVD